MSTVDISRGGLGFGIQCFITNRRGSQINQDQASQRRASVRNVASNRHTMSNVANPWLPESRRPPLTAIASAIVRVGPT